DGSWANQVKVKNTSADASPTASQMARLLGLGYASKLYRQIPGLDTDQKFSQHGNEIAFGTIGNASTSEGIFWETLNAAGVLEIPMIISVWDDGYGISVPNKFQTTKESISKVCAGFARDNDSNGYKIAVVRGWNYPELLKAYRDLAKSAREEHIPGLIHVIEMSQPQGHSTSGSHERYKSKDRLLYEQSIDCLTRMREWLIEQGISNTQDLDKMEDQARREVLEQRNQAWEEYQAPLRKEREALMNIYQSIALESADPNFISLKDAFQRYPAATRKSIMSSARRAAYVLREHPTAAVMDLRHFIQTSMFEHKARYNSKLMLEGPHSATLKAGIPAIYEAHIEKVDGRNIIQRCFDHHLQRDPRVFIIGEDVGKLGGVNLEFEGLSEKYGDLRVTDTGIREATILGQGIGAALRGLRPIVDIQYLDYLLYAFQLMSDDLASLHYRTAGGQTAPVIIRTKGHRLEGIWHTGSPMGMIIHAVRGIHVCVPRNMVQAAGMYNTLLEADDPALVVEVLNGYRVKEDVPSNLQDFAVPLGVPDVLRQGSDVTVVSYGACLGIIAEALPLLDYLGIDIELIDIQTLLPFDRFHTIKDSLHKTNALLVVDEDVPGGASAFILQQIIEVQGAYELLDAPPRTLAAKEHRSPYGSDGDYFTKPSVEDVIEVLYEIMRERQPLRFSELGLPLRDR
ncbi:MAG: thiamine pyrophosphate-dependent enzyme, partial [Proteobacteria bacterium]|nr:thiamine pyrophosphate-dependent enzyme [Pseudomonadota bacterium]